LALLVYLWRSHCNSPQRKQHS